MSADKKQTPHKHSDGCGCGQAHGKPADPQAQDNSADVSRRGFLGGSGRNCRRDGTRSQPRRRHGQAEAHGWHDEGDWDDKRWRRRGDPPRGGGHRDRILLKGGVVLSLDPAVKDWEKADVLIEGKKIKAVGPNLHAGGAQTVDCTGMIVMPGFITTHHHQYETLMRSIIPDGLLAGAWPQESYGSVVQNIWTAGRIGTAAAPTWDLGRPPLDPKTSISPSWWPA